MKILFTARKTRPHRSLKTFTEEKLAKIERVLDGIVDAHVILTQEKHRCLVEIILKSRAARLTARAQGQTFQDAVMLCVDRLVAQAKKRHERIRERRKRPRARSLPRRIAVSAPAAGSVDDGDARPRVVRMGRVPAKPMSLAEAVLQVRESRDPFVVFLNAESQQIAVLYKRSDGQFGLVETEA